MRRNHRHKSQPFADGKKTNIIMCEKSAKMREFLRFGHTLTFVRGAASALCSFCFLSFCTLTSSRLSISIAFLQFISIRADCEMSVAMFDFAGVDSLFIRYSDTMSSTMAHLIVEFSLESTFFLCRFCFCFFFLFKFLLSASDHVIPCRRIVGANSVMCLGEGEN